MFYRQRIIFELLEQLEKPISKTRFVKLLFLLRAEGLTSDINFYYFLPYKYGPFSFELYNDIRKLEEKGSISTFIDGKSEKIEIKCRTTEHQFYDRVKLILSKYGNLPTQQLLEYVYNTYPWFTVNSDDKRIKIGVAPLNTLFTIGYEKKSIDNFLNLLLSSGIKEIIDIRNNPVSRVYGFYGKTLNRLSQNVGLKYTHLPEYGISSFDRKKAKSSNNFEELFQAYSNRINGYDHSVIIEKIKSLPSVLVCQEADFHSCHRSVLSDKLSAISRIKVVNL